MTLEILICSLNKGIVRVEDLLQKPREDVSYLICYQYTDERYLELIPDILKNREDVRLFTFKEQGLSLNRNNALDRAKGDVLLFADDDVRYLPDSFDKVIAFFQQNPSLQIAFFQASTYTGKPLRKDYWQEEKVIGTAYYMQDFSIIEMACLRECIQNKVRFDERFGLGAKFLTCYEERVWFRDLEKIGCTQVHYFPVNIVETSTLLKQRMIYEDVNVQRSYAAMLYYIYGSKAWGKCLAFSLKAQKMGNASCFTLLKHFWQGIKYIKHTK